MPPPSPPLKITAEGSGLCLPRMFGEAIISAPAAPSFQEKFS
jgi:hypothetical protein